jgi:hypothetical protein
MTLIPWHHMWCLCKGVTSTNGESDATAVHFGDGGRLCTRRIEPILGPRRTDTLPEALLGRTRAALDRQRGAIIYRDVIGIADFLLPSSTARFYIAVVEIYQPLTEASETTHIRSIDGS